MTELQRIYSYPHDLANLWDRLEALKYDNVNWNRCMWSGPSLNQRFSSLGALCDDQSSTEIKRGMFTAHTSQQTESTTQQHLAGIFNNAFCIMSVKNLWSANGPDYSTAQKDCSKIVLWGKVFTSIKFMRSEEWLIFTKKKKTVSQSQRDTVSYGTALTWTLLWSVWKEFTSTRNQMNASAASRDPLQSCLVFHLILDLLQKTYFLANSNSYYDIISSYLVKNRIQRNMNRRGEKRVGAGREKSLSFTKITKEMNQ